MENERWISLEQLAGHYEIEVSFIHTLGEYGLVEVTTIENIPCVDRECLADVERLMRLHYDLEINLAGLDAISHLLQRIRTLQKEVTDLRNRLGH
jgi:hypothetical protein